MKILSLITFATISLSAFAGGSGGIKSVVGPAVRIDEAKQLIIIDLEKINSINTLSVGVVEARDVKSVIDRIDGANLSANILSISLKSNELIDIKK